MKKAIILVVFLLICFLLINSCAYFEPIIKDLMKENEDTDTNEPVAKQSNNRTVIRHPSFEEYKKLNDAEKRYQEYKDTDQILILKLIHLDYINKSRVDYDVPPVKLDILASRVANRMSREACEQKFRGHWNIRGEKPYHRYAFAEGVDHVSENASALRSSVSLNTSSDNYLNLMKKSHDSFMAEKPPNDGHKQNCIDKNHNYVGIGVYLLGGEFRYYEEFVDRYIEFVDFKPVVETNESFTIIVKPIDEKYSLFALISYYESFPRPLTPDEINRRGAYPDYTNTQSVSYWPWDLENYETGRIYKIPLKFSKNGLYYIQIYLSKEKYNGGTANTKGKVQGSGLVIQVK